MAATETQVGIGKIFALDGFTVTLSGALSITVESANLSHDFEIIESSGQDGSVENMMAFKEKLELGVTFVPKGATRAAAISAIAASKPSPLAKFTISGASVAAYNGDYNYVGGWAPKMTKEGIVICDIKLRAHIVNRATLAAAAISG